jgi:hypothetical protein
MAFSSLATPCGLFCGFCRFYMNKECKGCGSEDRQACTIHRCCRVDKGLIFCTECERFPCDELKESVGLDARWLEALAQLPPKRWNPKTLS